MVVKVYINGSMKTRREIAKAKKKGDYAKLKDLIYDMNNEVRNGLNNNQSRQTGYAKFVKNYRKNLKSIKQISFDPLNKYEIWEIKDRKLIFTISLSREIGSLGFENVYINSVWAEYRGIKVNVSGNLYSELGLSGGHSETMMLFKLLTDYTREIIKKEVKK